MKERDPLEKFFDELTRLVEVTQEKKLTPTDELPANIKDRLNVLRNELDIFNSTNEMLIAKAGITDEDIRQILEKPDSLPERRKVLIERSKRLKDTVDEIQRSYKIASTIAKKSAPGDADKNKQVLLRKKKFRGMGGQKDWKPL